MATAKPKMAAQAGSKAALRVVSLSPQNGFRRAGMFFTNSPTILVLSELTQEQVDKIKGEPMLDVTETTLIDELLPASKS